MAQIAGGILCCLCGGALFGLAGRPVDLDAQPVLAACGIVLCGLGAILIVWGVRG